MSIYWLRYRYSDVNYIRYSSHILISWYNDFIVLDSRARFVYKASEESPDTHPALQGGQGSRVAGNARRSALL